LKVLLVDRFPQHRYRSLDHRVLARRFPNRALAPIVLLSPHALSGRRLGAPTAETLVQVAPVFVEVFGLRLRRHPIDARCARRVRVAGCLPKEVFVEQGGQRCTHTIGIVGGLRRNRLEVWCDGW
jgi:hypothetical protein